MKYLRLIVLLLLPMSGLFAQDYDPEFSDPDSLYFESDTLGINPMDTTVNVEQSSVMEMLDMISNISYFRDVYLDIDSSLWNPYGFAPYEVPTYPDSVYEQRIKALARETNIPLTYNARVKAYNAAIRRLPASLFAGALGFGKKDYFEPPAGEAAVQQVPSVSFQ